MWPLSSSVLFACEKAKGGVGSKANISGAERCKRQRWGAALYLQMFLIWVLVIQCIRIASTQCTAHTNAPSCPHKYAVQTVKSSQLIGKSLTDLKIGTPLYSQGEANFILMQLWWWFIYYWCLNHIWCLFLVWRSSSLTPLYHFSNRFEKAKRSMSPGSVWNHYVWKQNFYFWNVQGTSQIPHTTFLVWGLKQVNLTYIPTMELLPSRLVD